MLTIRKTQVFHGPSRWGRVPVIVMRVDAGEFEERLRRETPVFFDRLIALVPSLGDQGAVVSQPEGGLRRLLIDRLAVALQNLAGDRIAQLQRGLAARVDLTYAETHPTINTGVYRVVYEYEHDEVGIAAGTIAVRLLNHLIAKSEPDFDLKHELETTLVPLTERFAYPWMTEATVAAAQRRGIPVQRLPHHSSINGDLVQLGTGAHQRHVAESVPSETAWVAVKIAEDQEFTTRLLQDAGLPVQGASVVQSTTGAEEAAEDIDYPVLVKPLDARSGRSAAIEVGDEAELRHVFPMAKRESSKGRVSIERFIGGQTYHILVIDDQVVAVLERRPAHVIGDGKHTVAELIAIANADSRRGAAPDTTQEPIAVDERGQPLPDRQQLTLDAVPAEGRVAILMEVAAPTPGSTKRDLTDQIHPDNAVIARQAARVAGLDVAGIDFITPDIALSAREQGGAIIGVNAQPGLHEHFRPPNESKLDVGMAIIDMLFPPGRPSRVPVVAVTGTNGKTTTTRMIAHIMQTAGKTVGMSATGGMYINGHQIASGDLSGPISARRLLRNPAIDYAVFETAAGGLHRDGLGFPQCDVAVVTNVAADHLHLGDDKTLEGLARLKAVVPSVVVADGASVLNADNPYTVAMASAVGGEILFFSLDEQNPVIARHLRSGGRAVVLQTTDVGEMLTLLADQEETDLLLAAEIPATMNGFIRVNIANALAAATAAIAQQVPLETIRTALRSFSSSLAQSPGRFNQIEIDGRQIVVDYFHNLHGLEAIVDFVQRVQPPHTVAAIGGVAGHHADEHITAIGKLAAESFDELIILDATPGYLRGRELGEVVALLQAGAIAGGLPSDKITRADNELEAADIALAKSRKDSLIVLGLDEAAAVLNYLTQRYSTGTPV